MSRSGSLLAVVPVRGGVLPLGGAEAVAEAGGRALLVGDGCVDASEQLTGIAVAIICVDLHVYAPTAAALAVEESVAREARSGTSLLLPASPDGRDLAPRLAHGLDLPLLAGAVEVHALGARLLRQGGLVMVDVVVDGPFVATLQPGVRGAEPDPALAHPTVTAPDLTADGRAVEPHAVGVDPVLVAITPPDPATMDLAEAPRIVGGGAGMGSAEAVHQLGEVATALGCSLGATRVVTDWGWVPVDRQIGTTGVAVHPELYLAFGISGAVQHTAGLGDPAHVIAVNTDPACPMMSLAALAVVTDAPAAVAALAARLSQLGTKTHTRVCNLVPSSQEGADHG